MDGLIGAIVGLAIAAVLAVMNSWLTDRAKVAEGVRDQQIRTYPAVWERTGVVSRWPRTDATRDSATRLHFDLRTWYYSGGGLFLSEESRERYEHLQVVLEAIAAQDPSSPFAGYDDLMDAASWFRTSLTADLQTRRSRNPFRTRAERKQQRAERIVAEERERQVGARSYHKDGATLRITHEKAPRVTLEDDDEVLRRPGPSASG